MASNKIKSNNKKIFVIWKLPVLYRNTALSSSFHSNTLCTLFVLISLFRQTPFSVRKMTFSVLSDAEFYTNKVWHARLYLYKTHLSSYTRLCQRRPPLLERPLWNYTTLMTLVRRPTRSSHSYPTSHRFGPKTDPCGIPQAISRQFHSPRWPVWMTPLSISRPRPSNRVWLASCDARVSSWCNSRTGIWRHWRCLERQPKQPHLKSLHPSSWDFRRAWWCPPKSTSCGNRRAFRQIRPHSHQSPDEADYINSFKSLSSKIDDLRWQSGAGERNVHLTWPKLGLGRPDLYPEPSLPQAKSSAL